MGIGPDISSAFFKGIVTAEGSETPVADRTVPGRCHLCGVGLIPYWDFTTSEAVNTNGTIKFEGINAAGDGGTGTALVEIPVISNVAYPVSTYVSFSDDDGYVLFENGIYLNQTDVGDMFPLTNFIVVLFYVGETKIA